MATAALIPIPFSSLSRLIATASRFCGRESSVLRPKSVRRVIRAGDVIRLALLAPELRFPIDINATVLARSVVPAMVRVRYELADLAQVEFALGQLYRRTEPTLPVALDVATFRERRCRMSSISQEGATFEVEGELSPGRCAPDTRVQVQVPHVNGRLELGGHVEWVTPRERHSRLHISFTGLAAPSRQMLDDIVFRFRLGAAPWTPRLRVPGL